MTSSFRVLVLSMAIVAGLVVFGCAEAEESGATLAGRALLPGDTFAAGPPSGAKVKPENGQTPPFHGQPVGGVSALLPAGKSSYWAMPDNGYGKKDNSADFLLRMYRFTPKYETAKGGPGTIDVGEFISLRDPDRHAGFDIVNGSTADRLLTGADFDIESVQRGPDGTLWFGDEFGPFLLHASSDGKLLEAPIELPGVKAPENPHLNGGSPTLGTSRGFEATALSADGKKLYPVLERSANGETDGYRRRIYEFDLQTKRYTGRTWQYRTDAPENSLSEMQHLGGDQYVLIERDSAKGADVKYKRIYAIDLGRTDNDGFVAKRQVADLLKLRNPHGIGNNAPEGGFGLGDPFSMPFDTVEALLPLGGGRYLVAQDNNYPSGSVRIPGKPDASELIVIHS